MHQDDHSLQERQNTAEIQQRTSSHGGDARSAFRYLAVSWKACARAATGDADEDPTRSPRSLRMETRGWMGLTTAGAITQYIQELWLPIPPKLLNS